MLIATIVIFATALVAASAATAAVIPAACRLGFTAGFNPIVPQARPPAMLGGGLGILAGVAASLGIAAWFGFVPRSTIVIALAATPALLLGLADDAHAMTPPVKLGLQCLAGAAGLAMVAGIPGNTYGVIIGGIAVFGAVVLMNAFNFLDVSDGYASGIGAVSFAGLAASLSGAEASVAVAGACLGFLLFNRPPAQIYMGDAGSHCLGMLGAIQIVGATRETPMATTLGVGAACFGVALIELIGVTVIRWRRGLSIWRGSSDHSALRLQRAGLSKAQALLMACATQGMLALGCWLVVGGLE